MNDAYNYAILQLRLKKRFLLSWLIPLLAIPVTFIPAYVAYYPNTADRQTLVAGMNSNMGIRAMYGVIGDPDQISPQPTTLGQLLAWQGGMMMVILGAIMAVLLIISSYRRPESSSLAELPRAAGISRTSTTVGSILLLGAVSASYGLGTFLGCAAMSAFYSDVSLQGSAAYGTTLMCTTFASGIVAALATLLTNNPHAITRTGLLTVGIGFLLRAAADTNDGIEFLDALTPLGWLRVFSPFTHNNWLDIFLAAIFSGVAACGLVKLDSHRQFNEGLLPERRRQARAPHTIASPLGLRLLLDRGTRMTWSIVAGALALFLASLTGSIGNYLDQDLTSAEAFEQMFPHKQMEAAFLTYTADLVGILIAIAAIIVVMHYRKEERGGELELQRSTGIVRTLALRNVSLSATLTALSAVLVAIVGASVGVVFGSASGSWATAALANLSQLGPALALAGLAAVVVGLWPRLSALAWLPLIASALIGTFGSLFRFPDWIIKASPFGHTLDYSSGLHVSDFVPLLVMFIVSVTGFAIGIAASARRDVLR